MFTGIFGGGSTHERMFSRTIIANTGDRVFIASDHGSQGRYDITVKAERFTKLSEIPINP